MKRLITVLALATMVALLPSFHNAQIDEPDTVAALVQPAPAVVVMDPVTLVDTASEAYVSPYRVQVTEPDQACDSAAKMKARFRCGYTSAPTAVASTSALRHAMRGLDLVPLG